MVTAARLYYEDALLAAGLCSLGPDRRPTWGTMVASEWQSWPFRKPLTLRLEDGRLYRAMPLTAEQTTTGQYRLTFEILPPAA